MKTPALPIVRRDQTVEIIRADKATREVELSFSSEYPVERDGVIEILDHGPSSVDLSRLNAGGSLLVNHDPASQVGVVTKAWVGPDRKGRAVVRFGNTDFAKAIFDDVREGIRRLVSVGYQVIEAARESASDTAGKVVLRVLKWLPLELSLVAIPADPSVGVGRGITVTETSNSHMNTTPQPGADPELSAAKEIAMLARAYGHPEAAAEAIERGATVDEFRAVILSKIGAKPVNIKPAMPPTEGDLERHAGRYGGFSLFRAVDSLASDGRLVGLEREVSDELGRRYGVRAKGFFAPVGFQRRELVHQVGSQGGYSVQTTVLGDQTIAALRPRSVVLEAGATLLAGVKLPISIPKIATGATAVWVGETAEIPDTDPSFTQVLLSQNAVACSVAFSKELAQSASMDLESLIRADLEASLGAALDKAAFQGAGSSGHPKGLFSFDTAESGINTVTYGAAATFAKSREAVASIVADNISEGSAAFIIDAATYGKWSTKSIDTGSGRFLWEGPIDGGLVGGFRGFVTEHVPSSKTVTGFFEHLLIAIGGPGVDVVVDPYTESRNRRIRLNVSMVCDLAVRHPQAFCVSTDSGAQ